MPKIVYLVSPHCVFVPEPDGEHVLAIHSTSGVRLRLSADLMAVVARFVSGATMTAILREFAGSAAALRPALRQLAGHGVLVDRAAHAQQAGERASASRLGPLELAVHRQLDTGGFFPEAIDTSRIPAAFKKTTGSPPPARAGAVIPLRRSTRRPASRLGLFDGLAMRHTQRRFSGRAMSRQKLAALLEHAAAASRIVSLPDLGTVSHRPYPSGGGRYPLEVYPCVYRVATLAPGIYHYDPVAHGLACVDDDGAHLEHLCQVYRARSGSGPGDGDPHVLLIITSVFERTAWKYRGIPYQLVLQEVGALYQTLYLVATELGLAACPIGAFPALATSRYLGSDGVSEAQVGLFAVGTPGRPATPWRLVACRIVRPSPFSGRGKGYAVELVYHHGVREIVDATAVAFVLRNGRLSLAALGGRERAVLDAELAAALVPRIRRQRGRQFVELDGGRIAVV